jgi:hypothetical protein
MALLATAWVLYADKEALTPENLTLEYNTDEDGNRTLADTPTVGGIDLGNPERADENSIKAIDPSPDQIAQRAAAIKAKNGNTPATPAPKKPKMVLPILKPAKAGADWDSGDVAWVFDKDGEHYLATVKEVFTQESTNQRRAMVVDASGKEWVTPLKHLYSNRPGAVAPKTTPKMDGSWQVNALAWVKAPEPWQGTIVEISGKLAKLKVRNGHKGAGNVRAARLADLCLKQPAATA